MAVPFELRRGHVDLWYVRIEDAKRNKWPSQSGDILSLDERERHQKFVFEKDRDQFLISHAMLRNTLSRYFPRSPEDWRFQTNEFGKPEIGAGQNPSQLRFNLSHCDGLVVCGITVGCDIGVDCENVDRQAEIAQLAERVFSASERDYLDSIRPSRRKETFFRLWTLKEAYIKARGLGMAIPLPQISFDLNATPRIAVSFAPGIEDDPEDWQFAQPEIPKPFVSAVALNVPSNEQLRVHLHEA